MRIRRFAAGTVLAAIIASLTLLASPGPARAADGIVLPVRSHWQTLADSHHVYISAPYDDVVVTTDHDGRVLKTIEGLDGARGMTLSRDESTLYVALSEADAIAAVDTTTLTETRRFATGAGTEPENLAVAGGKLWFSYQANLFDASIGSISVADADPVVDLGDDAVWYGKPQLAVSPLFPDRLVAVGGETVPGMRVYDVSSGTAQETAYSDAIGGVSDLAMTPDGQTIVTAYGSNYFHSQWRISDLTEIGRYETGPYPNSVAIAPNGMVAAGIVAGGDWDIYLYQPGSTTAIRKIALSWPHMDLLARGVAWAPDGNRLFATRLPYLGKVTLDIVTDLHKASSDITLQAPATGQFGKRLTIHGTLSSLVPHPANARVTVTRDDVPIADVPVAAGGTFTFRDSPPLPGWYEYTVSYAGDTDHVAGTASIIVDFIR
ncbi:hypothetical protein ACFY20_46290 [Streptomyces sp. NPDC001312]|uniref:hypothetical protein n=1 Tax=Streptomyces sp. NPDC001312 TaxID=3364561 RepID=UPI00367CE2E9